LKHTDFTIISWRVIQTALKSENITGINALLSPENTRLSFGAFEKFDLTDFNGI
jgi:hypothetical protein